jgi:hypothetical protein
MRHHFTNRVSFFEPEIFGGFDAPIHPPMFFVGIQREMAPPICFGHSQLQRMRVIVVEPDRATAASDVEGDPPFELLPQLQTLPHRRALQPRLVNGEILRGENDELYERIGNRIRRLRTLAAGPNGEVIDIARSEPSAAEATGVQAENKPARAEETSTVFRQLLPEPGQWRVVPFGAFKQIFTPQLTHPERLRDSHRLTCQAKVFELTAPQGPDQLAIKVLGREAAGQLQLLTPAIVMQLQLGSLLPPPQLPPAARTHGILLPGDRVFHLRLTNDPTAEEAVPEGERAGVNNPGYNDASVQRLKTKIPDNFVRPWEFQMSREEALYDLSSASTFLGSLGGKLHRLIHCFAFRRELRKWQMLLHGKTADEQLWSVRPPRSGLTHRFVQAWAQSALQLAGYDSRNIFAEWQIFWRRKGA